VLSELLTNPLVALPLLAGSIVAAVVTSVFGVRLAERGEVGAEDVVRRIFRNSAIPIASQLMVRAVDLAVAIVLLRLLGPAGNGQYALAVVIWLYVKTISDFGLSLLVTRDIARDPSRLGTLVGATTLFRWLVFALVLIPTTTYVLLRWSTDGIQTEGALAVALLLLSVIPSSYAEAVSSALNGLQRMELAAWINIGVSAARAPAAVVLTATSLGVVGVALAALVTSVLSAIAFHRVLRALSNQPIRWMLDSQTAGTLARESWPLLVNALLISLFFRVDVFIIQAAQGDAALGVYDAAYKPINLLTIIPAYATLAVFPLLAQRADDPSRLARAQRMTSYLLVIIAWLVVVAASAIAEPAIQLLAGSAYLPESALLLRILIWFAPLSFLNGVYQYVLVATGKQRQIVPVFGAAVTFNLIANVILVPLYGARAAAVLTVVTELVILLAFVAIGRRLSTRVLARDALRHLARPTVSGMAGAGVALYLRDSPWLALGAALSTFALLAALLRVVGPDERALLERLFRRTPEPAVERSV
jgi:O-antigen/teichoic acid export membrane protein